MRGGLAAKLSAPVSGCSRTLIKPASEEQRTPTPGYSSMVGYTYPGAIRSAFLCFPQASLDPVHALMQLSCTVLTYSAAQLSRLHKAGTHTSGSVRGAEDQCCILPVRGVL